MGLSHKVAQAHARLSNCREALLETFKEGRGGEKVLTFTEGKYYSAEGSFSTSASEGTLYSEGEELSIDAESIDESSLEDRSEGLSSGNDWGLSVKDAIFLERTFPDNPPVEELFRDSTSQVVTKRIVSQSKFGLPWKVAPFASTSGERRIVQSTKSFGLINRFAKIPSGDYLLAPTRYSLEYMNHIFWGVQEIRKFFQNFTLSPITYEANLKFLLEAKRYIWKHLVFAPLREMPSVKALLNMTHACLRLLRKSSLQGLSSKRASPLLSYPSG